MSSFSRNTRRAHSDLRARAIGAGLALALASGTALADGAHRFVFTAYSDAAGGADVLAGRYQAALVQLKGRPDIMELDPSTTNTNRCVAYSMTLQWQQARAACDAAVREATETSYGDYLALTYANRAVMLWMSHDEAAAEKDLAEAQELAPRADFVAQNLAALQMHVTVARAAAAAPKR
jgi:hypothetical protein